MSKMEYMTMSNDGTAEIIISAIACFGTIALHVFFLLPFVFKKTYDERPPYDIPFYVVVPVHLYCVACNCYLLVLYEMFESRPIHYTCLLLSNGIVGISSFLSTFRLELVQEKKWFPVFWSLHTPFFSGFSFFIMYNVSTPGMYELTGVVTTVCGIIMYAAPLPIVMNRRKLETVHNIPLWLSIGYFVNGFAWVTVSLLSSYFDPYLCVTHGVGTILGLIHLGIILETQGCFRAFVGGKVGTRKLFFPWAEKLMKFVRRINENEEMQKLDKSISPIMVNQRDKLIVLNEIEILVKKMGLKLRDKAIIINAKCEMTLDLMLEMTENVKEFMSLVVDATKRLDESRVGEDAFNYDLSQMWPVWIKIIDRIQEVIEKYMEIKSKGIRISVAEMIAVKTFTETIVGEWKVRVEELKLILSVCNAMRRLETTFRRLEDVRNRHSEELKLTST